MCYKTGQVYLLLTAGIETGEQFGDHPLFNFGWKMKKGADLKNSICPLFTILNSGCPQFYEKASMFIAGWPAKTLGFGRGSLSGCRNRRNRLMSKNCPMYPVRLPVV